MKPTDILSMTLVATIATSVVLWLRLRAPRTRLFVLAGVLVWGALLLESFGLLTRTWGWNNNPVYNIFQAIEFLLVLEMARAAEPSLRRSLRVVGIIGLVGFAWSIYEQRGLRLLSGNAILLFGLLSTFVLVRVLFLMARTSTIPLQHRSAFWLFLGCLLYFAALGPLIGGLRLLYAQDRELVAALWGAVPILAILRYVLVAWACHLEQQRSTS